MLKDVIICADDFGLGEGINQGILNLASKGKVNAVSVMINFAHKHHQDFLKLKSISPKIEIGLHLDLELIMDFHSAFGFFWGPLKKEAIRNEILKQLKSFNDFFGFWPDFVDSHKHQHIHPIVNNILIKVIINLGIEKPIYLRNTYSNSAFYFFSARSVFKKIILDVLGFYAKANYIKNNIATNDSFLGVLSYGSDHFSSSFIMSQLKLKKGFTLFYTHPAVSVEDLKGVDPYLEGRIEEYQILSELKINQ